MINRDGEEILFCETRFPVQEKDTGAIVALLDEAADWVRAEGATPFWNWVSSEDSPLPSGQGEGICLVGQLSGGGSLLGTLELVPGTLALHTNSPGRADRGQRVLADLLGARIGKPLSKLTTVEQVLAERDKRPKGPAEDDRLDPQLAAQLERQFLDEHYRKKVDVPIPALGNLSPRECAQTPQGRSKLIEWLKQLENHELHRAARDGKIAYDPGWLWKELGVDDLR